MNIEFLSITVEHFRSFAEAQTLHLAPSGGGLYFMRGDNQKEPALESNGGGKTSLWSALCWCLYGKTPDNLKNPDIKPWDRNVTPRVTVVLRLDGEPHTVERAATTNGLKIDGQQVGPEEAARLIGLDFDVFINTILWPQHQELFFDRLPKEKIELFTRVLPLEQWDERSARASTRVRELEALESELRGELFGAETSITQTQQLLTQTQQASARWEEEARDQLAQFEDNLKAQQQLLAQQEERLGAADVAYDRAATEAKALRVEVPKLAEKLSTAREKLALARQSLRGWEGEIAELERELKALGQANTCPTCGQSLKGTSLAAHKQELAGQISELKLAIKKGNIDQFAAAVAAAEKTYTAQKNALDAFEDEANRALTSLNFLKPQVAELRAKALALSERKTEKRAQANPYTEQVQTLRRRLAQLEVNKRDLEEDVAKATRQIERTRFWVKGFKDVQLYIIEDVLQEMELTANVMLDEVGLHGWRVVFSTEKETKSGTIQRGINVSILSPHNKKPVRWECWSGGEKQRLRIIGALALSEVLLTRAGVRTNLEVLDEPTQHLSPSGVDDLCMLLNEHARQLGRACWLIDHTAREAAYFVGGATVVKTQKGSEVVQ